MKRTFEYSITVIVDGPNEVASEDAIDHAQPRLEDFGGHTPSIPGSTAYTPPNTSWQRERNSLGQFVAGDGERNALGQFTGPKPSNNPNGKPIGALNHCALCGAVNRNRLTCLARFSRTRSGMKHRKRGNGRVYATPLHVRRQYPDRQFTDRHHRAWQRRY
jgi:hypothetical protein